MWGATAPKLPGFSANDYTKALKFIFGYNVKCHKSCHMFVGKVQFLGGCEVMFPKLGIFMKGLHLNFKRKINISFTNYNLLQNLRYNPEDSLVQCQTRKYNKLY